MVRALEYEKSSTNVVIAIVVVVFFQVSLRFKNRKVLRLFAGREGI